MRTFHTSSLALIDDFPDSHLTSHKDAFPRLSTMPLEQCCSWPNLGDTEIALLVGSQSPLIFFVKDDYSCQSRLSQAAPVASRGLRFFPFV